MARIRTIKPEFPHSESIGRLSRDARLLFIQLWTLVDDEGRARAASRMLASLLYPYDNDAAGLIDGWLAELQSHGLIRLYAVEGSSYLEIPNWLKHQKIDKPSKSRLPAFSEEFAKPREPSRSLATDLGPRTVDLGPSEADASDAGASPDVRTELFNRGLETLARVTGKTPSSCRSVVGKWLKACNDEAIHVLAAIDDAATDRIVDPIPWIEARLKPKFQRGTTNAKTTTNGLAQALGHLREHNRENERGEEGRGAVAGLLPHG